MRRLAAVLASVALVAAGCGGDREPAPPEPPRSVVVIGDSLAEGTAPLLPGLLPGWDVRQDHQRGRPLAVGMQVLEATPLPRGAVLAFSLFTNDEPDQVAALEAAVRGAAGRGCSVWATVVHPRDFTAANARLLALDRELDDVVVVDWAAAAAKRPELIRPDGVHGTPEGNRARAELYADAIRRCD